MLLASMCICFEGRWKKDAKGFLYCFNINNIAVVWKVALVPYHQTTEQLRPSGCETTRLILSAINIRVRPTDEVMKNQSTVSQMVLLAYVGHVEESLEFEESDCFITS